MKRMNMKRINGRVVLQTLVGLLIVVLVPCAVILTIHFVGQPNNIGNVDSAGELPPKTQVRLQTPTNLRVATNGLATWTQVHGATYTIRITCNFTTPETNGDDSKLASFVIGSAPANEFVLTPNTGLVVPNLNPFQTFIYDVSGSSLNLNSVANLPTNRTLQVSIMRNGFETDTHIYNASLYSNPVTYRVPA
jgi:hypothetical protein